MALPIFLSAILFLSPTCAEQPITLADANLASPQEIVARLDSEIDLQKVASQIDQMIDPSIDVAANLARLQGMSRQISFWLPATATSDDKVVALRIYLYQPGQRNEHHTFKYDLDARERLGIEVTTAAAPEHILVKYRNNNGQFRNLEATDGAGVIEGPPL